MKAMILMANNIFKITSKKTIISTKKPSISFLVIWLAIGSFIFVHYLPHWVIADRYLRKMRKAQQKEEEERQKQQVEEINQSTEVIEVHAPPKDSSSTAVDLHIVQQKEETTSNNTSLPKKKPLITVIEESSEEVKEPPATSEKKEPREECICSYLEVQSVVVQHYVQQNIPIIQPVTVLFYTILSNH